MRKTHSVLSSIASKCQRRATCSATRAVYQIMWGEEPKKKGAYKGDRAKNGRT